MTTASVTSKGQITIPVAVREAMHVRAGDRVEFVEIEPGRYEFIAATRPVTALKGASNNRFFARHSCESRSPASWPSIT